MTASKHHTTATRFSDLADMPFIQGWLQSTINDADRKMEKDFESLVAAKARGGFGHQLEWVGMPMMENEAYVSKARSILRAVSAESTGREDSDCTFEVAIADLTDDALRFSPQHSTSMISNLLAECEQAARKKLLHNLKALLKMVENAKRMNAEIAAERNESRTNMLRIVELFMTASHLEEYAATLTNDVLDTETQRRKDAKLADEEKEARRLKREAKKAGKAQG